MPENGRKCVCMILKEGFIYGNSRDVMPFFFGSQHARAGASPMESWASSSTRSGTLEDFNFGLNEINPKLATFNFGLNGIQLNAFTQNQLGCCEGTSYSKSLYSPAIAENQMAKKMEHEMETAVIFERT